MSTTLVRVDATRHMARFYALDIQPTLFGDWTLVREWGRIGSAGTVRLHSYATEQEAVASLLAITSAKLRRGYQSPRIPSQRSGSW